jgi:chromosome segregation ATPase
MNIKSAAIVAFLLISINATSVSLDFEDSDNRKNSRPKETARPAIDFPPFPFLNLSNLPQPKPAQQKDVQIPIFVDFPKPEPKPRQEIRPIKITKESDEKFELPDFFKNLNFAQKPQEKNVSCSDSLKEANEKIGDLLKQNQAFKSKIDEAFSQISKFKEITTKQAEENNQLKNKFKTLFSKFGLESQDKSGNEDELMAKINEKNEQIAKLTDDNQKLFKDNRELNELVKKLKEDLKKPNEETEFLLEKVSNLTSTNSKLSDDNKNLSARVAALEATNKNLQADFDRLGKMSVEFFRLKKEADSYGKEKSGLLAKIQEFESNNSKLVEDNTQLFQDNKNLNGQVSKLTIESKQLREKFSLSEKNLKEFEKNLEKVISDFDSLKKINASLNARLEIAEKNFGGNDKSSRQTDEFKSIISLLEKRLKSFEEDKKTTASQINDYKNQVTSLNEQLFKLMIDIDEKTRNCAPVTKKVVQEKKAETNNFLDGLPSFFLIPQPSKPAPEAEKKPKKNNFMGSALFSDLE